MQGQPGAHGGANRYPQCDAAELLFCNRQKLWLINFFPVESEARTDHGRVGSGRPAERPGGVRQDWVPMELFAQETKVYCTLQKKKKCRFNDSPEAQTREILCKPTEEQNHRLTRG